MDDLIHAFFDFKDVEYKYIIMPSMDNIIGRPVLCLNMIKWSK